MNIIHKQFDSIDAFSLFVRTSPKPTKTSYLKSDQRDKGFFEFEDWNYCQTAILLGWEKGVKAVEAQCLKLEKDISSTVMRETYTPAVTGAFFDVGLVLTGEPECWLEAAEEPMGSKIVTIALNCGVSAAINGKTIIQRGAALCALVKLLETQGKSCRVIWSFGMYTDYEKTEVLRASVTLKEAGQPIDIDSLAFWLVCPDAFRRMAFRWMETEDVFWKKISGTYGWPDSEWTPEADIQMGAIRSGEQWDDERSKRWVTDIMKAQGIAFE